MQLRYHARHLTKALLLAGLFASAIVQAGDYRSVAVANATLFESPSLQAKKVWILSLYYPVEIIVNLGQWLKVRDAEGGLYWLEANTLSTRLTALVVDSKTDLRQSDSATSTLLAILSKDVVVDVLGVSSKRNWIKVRHYNGITGYVARTALWGVGG